MTTAPPMAVGPHARTRAEDSHHLVAPLVLGLVCVAVGWILLYQSHNRPVIEPREYRIFAVVEGMLFSGDYLLPRLDDEPRVNKPPLYYWLAAAVELTTNLPRRVAYRLPSVIAAVALIPCVFWLARGIGARAVALPAALAIPALTLLYPNGRVANYDMLLATLTCAAVAAFTAYARRGGTGWLVAAGVGFVLAFLEKGTPAYAAVLVPVTLILWGERRLRWLWSPSGLTFVLLPVLVGRPGWPSRCGTFRRPGRASSTKRYCPLAGRHRRSPPAITTGVRCFTWQASPRVRFRRRCCCR